MRMMKEGDEIDLGGRGFRAVEPVVRDMRTTWWGFETRERVLFPGDGFAYSHYHEDGHCGLVAEEAASLDLQDTTAVFADLALWWTKWADMRNYCARLDLPDGELDVKTVCPTHGLVITDVARTMPKVKEGLLFGSQRRRARHQRRLIRQEGRSGAGRDRRLKLCREKGSWPSRADITMRSRSSWCRGCNSICEKFYSFVCRTARIIREECELAHAYSAGTMPNLLPRTGGANGISLAAQTGTAIRAIEWTARSEDMSKHCVVLWCDGLSHSRPRIQPKPDRKSNPSAAGNADLDH